MRSVMLGVWALLLMGAQAPAEDLARITDDINRVGVRLKTLTEEYLKPEVLDGLRSFDKRMADAEVLYLLGDFSRASLVLYDLVGEPRNRAQALYPQAVYYLSESFFQMGNYRSARQYFQQVVALKDKARLRDAVRRLIQIGDAERAWDGVEANVRILAQEGALPPDIAYIQAKSLLRQDQAIEALAAAELVPETHRLYPKALYVGSVARLVGGDFDGARAGFEKLLTLSGNYEDFDDVKTMAAMNRGRLYFEAGKFSESIDAYQYVSRDSPMFEQALYEMTWTYVRSAQQAPKDTVRAQEYQKARNALEILLLSEAETSLAPEARLLLGNILLRLGKFESASEAFDEVLERYQPIQEELGKLRASVGDPIEYYRQLAARKDKGEGLLPPLAVKWAGDTPALQDALKMMADLDQSAAWLKEGQEIVDKLVAVLNSDRKSQFFPALREAVAARKTLGNNLTALSQRLLAVERELLTPVLDGARRDELDKVLSERAALEAEYRKTSEESSEGGSDSAKASELRSKLETLETAAYRLRYPVKAMRNEVEAIRSWMLQNPKTLSEADAITHKELMAQQERELQAFEAEQTALETEIRQEKSLKLVSAELAHAEAVRSQYEATLDKEREILASVKDNADPDAKALLATLEERQLRLGQYYAELEAFGAKLDAAVDAKATELRVQVQNEAVLLAGYGQTIDPTRTDAERAAGEVAAGVLDEVAKSFGAIVLRADVGIVDVAWQLKDEQTKLVTKQVNEQRKELQLLDREFQEVLTEE